MELEQYFKRMEHIRSALDEIRSMMAAVGPPPLRLVVPSVSGVLEATVRCCLSPRFKELVRCRANKASSSIFWTRVRFLLRMGVEGATYSGVRGVFEKDGAHQVCYERALVDDSGDDKQKKVTTLAVGANLEIIMSGLSLLKRVPVFCRGS